ncbi:MAG: TonB-dependent receptor [Gemmatimonadaceae bacterium]|nr:TonB-dependent receptor [Gemmatimonadaceae bacterium]
MQMSRELRKTLWVLVASGVVGVSTLAAQGITTAAVSGVVTDSVGQPVESAQIQVTNQQTGVKSGSLTRANGNFYIQGVEVGGPYVVTVRRLGFAPDSVTGVRLTLGQNFRVNFKLGTQAAQLSVVTVRATSDTLSTQISSSRRGVQTDISDSALRRLPTLNRNFTDFLSLTPQVTQAQNAGLSGGGQNNRFNNIQIDGASESDLFGLGTTGQPGGQARGRSISLEAVKEYQVLLSPFDVRQGNFTGALINAVTKSGTNEFHGSVYYYFRNQDLAADVPLLRASEFQQKQYGFSIGGPIVKDKIHFFVSPEWQDEAYPAPGPYPGSAGVASAADAATIQRMTDILRDSYGLDAGAAGAVSNKNPLTNVFARLDFVLPYNSRLVIRDNYGKAELDTLFRLPTSFRFGSNAYSFNNKKNAAVAQLFTNWNNGANNELFLGYTTIRDFRPPNADYPSITVNTGITGTLIAGAESNSQGNSLDQDIFEITDNFTIPVGAKHRISVGTHNEFYKMDNLFARNSQGAYTFASLDSLEAGNPNAYTIGLNLGQGFHSKFDAANYSVYAEDQWTINDRFNVLYGIRLDVPSISSHPATNQLIDSLFNRDTHELPTGNVQWSPRVGFNWDVTGKQTDQLRGGVGVFQGRPAAVWLENTIANSGFGLGLLSCGAGGLGRAPAFNSDINNQPQTCLDSAGSPIGAGAYSEVDLLNKKLKYPQTLRATLGFDHQFSNGFVGTLEGIYTRGLNSFFYQNLNVGDPTGVDRFGRVIYATSFATNGTPTTNLVSKQFKAGGVYDVKNQSKDYSYQLTAQLKKRFSDALEASGAFTHGHSYTVSDVTSSTAASNFRFGRELAGNLLGENTGISQFDIPNKVLIAGTYTAPWKTWATTFSMIYVGVSGIPFDYVATGRGAVGDLNGDGVNGNDLLYVPRNARDPSEMLFANEIVNGQVITAQTQAQLFEQFIDGQKCLSDHRGEIMPRNACRSPWQNNMNVTVEQTLPSVMGKTLSLRLDVFNFLNMIDHDWGKVKLPSISPSFNNQPLVTEVGQTTGDVLDTQPIFNFVPASAVRWTSNVIPSYYQIQLSARLGF